MTPTALALAVLFTPTYSPSLLVGQDRDTLPHPLGEIVVSAKRPASEAVATVRVVTAADIRAYGARTLDEALALLPGVDVRLGAEGAPRVNLRGFRPRHVVLLLDGIPVNSTYDGQFDPAFLTVESIALIKLTTGTSSVLYGPGGLGGVINIVTRPAGGPLRGEVGGEVREQGGRLARSVAAGSIGPIRAFVAATGETTDGYPSFFPSPTLGPASANRRTNSDRSRKTLFTELRAAPAPSLEVHLAVQRAGGHYGVPPSVIDDPADPFANRPVYERVTDLGTTALHLEASYEPSARWWTRAWFYRNRLSLTREQYADARYDRASLLIDTGTALDQTITTLDGARLQAGIGVVPLGHLTVSVSAERDEWRLSARRIERGSGKNAPATSMITELDQSLARYTGAVDYGLDAGSGLQFSLGLLLARLEGQRDAAAGFASGASWSVSEATRFRAALSRSFRFPTIRQLYDRDGGNPDLATERALTAEIGVEQAIGSHLRASVALFHNQTRNFIERTGRDGPFENREAYRFRGLELVVEARRSPSLLLRSSYSRLDATDRSPGREGTRLAYRPRHKLTVEARERLFRGPTASATLEYRGGQIYESRRPPVQTARLPDIALAAIRLEQAFWRDRVQLHLGVRNLFNRAYEEAYGFPATGRVMYGGVDFRIR